MCAVHEEASHRIMRWQEAEVIEKGSGGKPPTGLLPLQDEMLRIVIGKKAFAGFSPRMPEKKPAEINVQTLPAGIYLACIHEVYAKFVKE